MTRIGSWPRDGATIFSDLIGKLDVLRVSCDKCERDVSYQLNGLIETRGRCRGNSFALIVYFRRPGLLEMRINLISRQLGWRNMPRKRGASLFIGLNRHRATDLKNRLAERDRRQLTDNRTPAEKYFGDPSPDRSVLARGLPTGTAPEFQAGGQRVDLWRR